MTYSDYRSCIDACLACACICNHCASSCLREEDVKIMAVCIQLDMECAVACYNAAQLMSLGSGQADKFCRLCAVLCKQCAEECAKYDMQHCRDCTEACRHCAEECMQMAESRSQVA